VLVADIEHGERLINTDDPAALETLRHRPSHLTGTRRQVEDQFIALQSEHFSQLLGEIATDLRGATIELGRMLRIMEMSFVAVAMFVTVLVLMPTIVAMAMSVFMIVRVLMLVFKVVTVLRFVIMLVAVPVGMLLFVIVFVFRFVFLAHCFAIPSNISH
jgi:hypothetical protein